MPETHNPGPIRRRCNARTRWACLAEKLGQSPQVPPPQPVVVAPKPNPKPAPAPDLFELTPEAVPMPERASIPFQQIIAAYHRHMADAGCPRVRTLSEATRSNVRSRWNEDKDRQTLDWWDQYFQYASTCPHLVGRGTSEWYADFTWMVGPKNMEKVINGRYQRG